MVEDQAEKKGTYGLGRRKTAIAQVMLTDDVTVRIVNNKPVDDYFPTIAMKKQVLSALETTSKAEKSGFKAKIRGGGKQAQAVALNLAIARAIVKDDESLRKQLKDTGSLTRDPRVKERKKFGLKRARRAPQFSKR
ncbi:MAG: 30S ribosomal protein S9 [Candidatus Andersenbacteria bacterium]|nr:30S ribosomal protein S9 [bacterium]MDZ4225337.1 30S ribosomal protein S9 [Candidatus Andersenbacteria bacterium]